MRSVHADGRRHGMQRRLAREFGLDRALDHTRESTFSLRAVRLDLLGTHALAGGVSMLASLRSGLLEFVLAHNLRGRRPSGGGNANMLRVHAQSACQQSGMVGGRSQHLLFQ